MSSSEPPRIHRGQSHETKAARDEITKKVEKVREVDPDEQARQRKKFRVMMGDEDQPVDMESQADRKPSPFETTFHRTDTSSPDRNKSPMESEETIGSKGDDSQDEFQDISDAIIPSPSYSPPPDVSTPAIGDEDEEEPSLGALPRSEDFWQDIDSPPDQPIKPNQYEETPPSPQAGFSHGPQKGKKGVASQGKEAEFSPFGIPGKPTGKAMKGQAVPEKVEKKEIKKKPEEKKKDKLPSPFEEAAKQSSTISSPKKKTTDETFPKNAVFKEDEKSNVTGRAAPLKISDKKENLLQKQEKDVETARFSAIEKGESGDEENHGGSKERQQKNLTQIDSPSLPNLPTQAQPIAQAATIAATPYLNPATMSLFYQMVGTIYMMTGPSGVNRTEIVLNNPSFANSKFYGSTITIEKYATAPDSFNIRLTGSDTAVAAFKDNLPSLMTAFQNGNFTFRVNRLDAEYTLERPVFRRKEKQEEKGGDFGGDLGERKK